MSPHHRAILTALLLVAASTVVAGTSASYNAKTTNAASFATDGLVAPVGPATALPQGTSVVLAWANFGSLTSGGTGFDHQIWKKATVAQSGTRNGSSAPTCASGDTFNVAGTTVARTVKTSTETTSATDYGAYVCYMVKTRAPAGSGLWLSPAASNPFVQAQVGFVVKSVTLANKSGGTAGTIEAGDTITVVFNQPITKSTGPQSTTPSSGTPTGGDSLCTMSTNNTLYVGRALFTACTATETLALGTITGFTYSAVTTDAYRMTWVYTCDPVLTTQCTSVTGTLGTLYSGVTNAAITGGTLAGTTFTPVPAANRSVNATGTATTLCTAANGAGTAGPTCRPIVVGTF